MPFTTFGTSNSFGQNQTTATNPAFGASAFGQSAQPTGGMFGAQRSNSFHAAPASAGFGTPSGTGPFGAVAKTPFGSSTNAFGGTSTLGGFGQPVINRTSTSPNTLGGGLLGSTTSGFSFGSQTAPTASTGFGTTSAFGGGGAFGQPQAQQSTAFGGMTGGFGSSSAPVFGGGIGGGAMTTPAQPGTGNPPFKPVETEEQVGPTATNNRATKNTNHFQAITSMSQYATKSFEELRFEDYQRGNKTGNLAATGGGFGGISTGFGSTTAAPSFGSSLSSSSPFGSAGTTLSGAFGASAASPFGSTAATSSGFGSTTTGMSSFGSTGFGAAQGQQQSMFGSSPSKGLGTTPAFGAGGFGAGATTGFGAAKPTGFGATTGAPAFGQAAGTSAFGAPTTGFGGATTGFGGGGTTGFGAGATTGGFGTGTTGFGTGTTGGFGTGSTGFGAATGFGAGTTTGFGAGTTTGGFGTTGFGTGTTGGFGTGTTGGFGTGTTGFGATGASTAAPAFGATGFGATSTGFGATSTGFGAPATTGFGSAGRGFGATGTTPGFGAAGGGFGSTGFGAPGATTTGFGTGLSGSTGFGSTFGAQGTQGAAGGFGAAPTTNFGFGGAAGGGFGAAPATSSGLGSTTGFGGMGATTGGFGGGFKSTFGMPGSGSSTMGFGVGGGGQQTAYQYGGMGGQGGMMAAAAAAGPQMSSLPSHSTGALATMFEKLQQRKHDVLEVHLTGDEKTNQSQGNQYQTGYGAGTGIGGGGGTLQMGGSSSGIGMPRSIYPRTTTSIASRSVRPRGYSSPAARGGLSSTAINMGGGGGAGGGMLSPEVFRGRSAQRLVIDPTLGDFDPGADLPMPNLPPVPSSSPTGLTPTVSFSPSLNGHSSSNQNHHHHDHVTSTPSSSSNVFRLAQSSSPPGTGTTALNPSHITMSESTMLSQTNENISSSLSSPPPSVSFNGYQTSTTATATSPGAWLRHRQREELSAEKNTTAVNSSSHSSYVPILTKPGYFTNPDIKLLQQMNSSELKSIPKFAILRPNIGRIEWEGETDIRGLNLDEIVKIEQGSVDVYEDTSESEKPPVGQGLNKSAIILLQNIFPKENISTKKRLEFVDKLQKCCVNAGSEFLDYDSETGDWVFRAAHFSRYGLGDDDSDDEIMDTTTAAITKKDNMRLQLDKRQPLQPPSLVVPGAVSGLAGAGAGHSVSFASNLVSNMTSSSASSSSTAHGQRTNPMVVEPLLSSVVGSGNEQLLRMRKVFQSDNTNSNNSYSMSTPAWKLQSRSNMDISSEDMSPSMMSSSYSNDWIIGGRDFSPIFQQSAMDEDNDNDNGNVGSPGPGPIPLDVYNPHSHPHSHGGDSELYGMGMGMELLSPVLFTQPQTQPQPPLEYFISAGRESVPIWPVTEYSSPCMQIMLQVKRSILHDTNQQYDDRTLPLTSVSSTGGVKIRPRAPVDMSLAMGRSFRVGWSADGRIIHCGKLIFTTENEIGPMVHRIVIEKISTVSSNGIIQLDNLNNKEKENIENAVKLSMLRPLESILLASSMSMSTSTSMSTASNDIPPLWRAPRGDPEEMDQYIQFVKLLKNIWNGYQDIITSTSSSILLQHEQPLWITSHAVALIEACCGQEDLWEKRLGAGKDVMNWERRREFLAKWLQSITTPEVSSYSDGIDNGELNQNTETYIRIFELLSCRRLQDAITLSRKAGLSRLSLLLSQLGGDDNVKHLIQRQIYSWEYAGAMEVIPPELIAIYRVLGGDSMLEVVATGTGTTREEEEEAVEEECCCVLSGLSWTRAVAMMFWYGGSCVDKLSLAICKYDEACSKQMVNPPLLLARGSGDRKTEPAQHALYSLLCTLLTADYYKSDGDSDGHHATLVVQSLFTDGFTSDPLDARGSYVVLILLECLGLSKSSSASSCIIRSQFIFQLLTEGYWQWAVFVALQIENESQRTALVKEILGRWAGYAGWEQESVSMESFVVNRLHVPSHWLHEVTAVRCGYSGKLYQQSAYLCLAGLWKDAGKIISKQIAPSAIFSSSSAENTLKDLLTVIEHEAMDRHASEHELWECGAGVLLEYYRIRDAYSARNELQSIIDGSNNGSGNDDDLMNYIREIAVSASSLLQYLANRMKRRDDQRGVEVQVEVDSSPSLIEIMEYDIGTYLFKLLLQFQEFLCDDKVMNEEELLGIQVVYDSARLKSNLYREYLIASHSSSSSTR
eukprot:gene3522-7007_t